MAVFFQWLAIPFAMTNSAVDSIAVTAPTWLGSLDADWWLGNYIDAGLMLIFGGIPWQVLGLHFVYFIIVKVFCMNFHKTIPKMYVYYEAYETNKLYILID